LAAALLSVVLVVLSVDIALRFLPLEWVTFRAWEAYKLNRAPAGAFVPNIRYQNPAVYGDLAALGNFPGLREYRAEVFTTDQYGFRNEPREWSESPPSALLIGSSFSVGPGMSDEETLGRQLTALDGRAVYNAAGYFDEISVSRTRAMASATGMSGGTVIVEYVERFDLPPPGLFSAGCGPGYPTPCGPAQAVFTRFMSLNQTSPFQIFIERGLKAVQNDIVLPNRYAGRVVQSRLRNGETMLFLPEEVARYERLQRDNQIAVERGAEFFRSMAAQLAADNLQLIVLLVPNKYTVYRPFLDTSAPPDGEASAYMRALEDRLRALEIPVVNLAPVFQEQAADHLERQEYIYWRDDTHWNPRGINLAARELLQLWAR
jgi:hypothetical protein